MKLIIAYIQPEKLNDVKKSLYEKEIFKLSVTNALGCGQQKGYHESYRGTDIEVNLLKKIRLEIAVNDSYVDATVEGIINGARTDTIGDGKIFILDLPDASEYGPGKLVTRLSARPLMEYLKNMNSGWIVNHKCMLMLTIQPDQPQDKTQLGTFLKEPKPPVFGGRGVSLSRSYHNFNSSFFKRRPTMSRITTLFIAVLLTLGTLTPLFGADVETSGGADLGSAYVWRGITFNDGYVFMPWLDVSKGPFNVNFWVNYDIDDYDGALNGAEYSEIDMTASWTFDLELVDVTVGLIEYTFPGGGTGTTELFTGVAYDTPIENLALDFTLYYDIDEVEDYYASLGVSYSYEIKEGITMDAGLTLGFAGDAYSASGDGGMYDLGVSVAVSYAYREDLSFSASVNYTATMDEDILPEQDVSTYFLIGASYTF